MCGLCYTVTVIPALVRCIVSPCSLLSLLFLFPFSTVDVLLLVFFNCFNFSLALPPLCLGYTTSLAYLNVHKFSFVCYISLNLFSSYINYPKFLANHFISICIAMRDTRKKIKIELIQAQLTTKKKHTSKSNGSSSALCS